MRIDKPELPFKDIKVRRALMMATDFETIKNTLYGGDAQINSWPLLYCKEYADAYLPLEEAPASVQELYIYNPDKAKSLLAEAGYANGFKTKIVCPSMPPTYIDYLSIIKDMWSKVGVEFEIEPKEAGAFFGIAISMNYDEMLLFGPTPVGTAFMAYSFVGANAFGNASHVDDPLANETKLRMGELEFMDFAETSRIHKEFMKYALDQVWAIPSPTPPSYHMWWPWLKNYHGEFSVGMEGSYNYPKWVWINQGLKKSMGY